jgi:hypothetical protein
VLRTVTFAVAFLLAPAAQAYSVLTHQAIVDSAWEHEIKPLLLKRFPRLTPEQLTEAHAYAYGGCILQDMGYYPFGSKFFSDLTHYVRSGDFVVNLVREARDQDEYAFALGALAHYAADNVGHPLAVNVSVPLEYPKLALQFGDKVPYEENPAAHMKVEFGFDVLEVAQGSYAPKAYHDFIGFEVSKPVLERAFQKTYCLELKDVFKSLDLAIGTYRRTVSSIIPEATKVAWAMNKNELMKSRPGITRKQFVYNVSRVSYEKEWGREYQRPGVVARILGYLLRVVPKIGPFRALALKAPTPETAKLFEASVNSTLALYRSLLAQAGRGSLQLPNRNFDTGRGTAPGQYRLADEAYAKLARKLGEDENRTVDFALSENILAYYRNLDAPFATKKNADEWQKTLAALDKLKASASSAVR